MAATADDDGEEVDSYRLNEVLTDSFGIDDSDIDEEL
jgi:uncharacterized tellurite resistance protein B-like protein